MPVVGEEGVGAVTLEVSDSECGGLWDLNVGCHFGLYEIREILDIDLFIDKWL